MISKINNILEEIKEFQEAIYEEILEDKPDDYYSKEELDLTYRRLRRARNNLDTIIGALDIYEKDEQPECEEV